MNSNIDVQCASFLVLDGNITFIKGNVNHVDVAGELTIKGNVEIPMQLHINNSSLKI